jgi:hypothetical protein
VHATTGDSLAANFANARIRINHTSNAPDNIDNGDHEAHHRYLVHRAYFNLP